MKNKERIAECNELAEYPDGTLVHVGLATGHNDGIDEDGFNHRDYFEAQKERGLYPQRIDGIRVTAVQEHVNSGRDVKTHWRAFAEDLDRILNDPESEYHKMAKEACLGLLIERRFNDIVNKKIPEFEFGKCQAELLINADGRQFFADVGVWDHRSRNTPIAMEISYTSPQTRERISALSQSGTHVYNFNILERTRNQLKGGSNVSVKFYRELMLEKKFTLQLNTEVKTPLQAFYIGVAELKRAEEQRRAIERAAMRHEQANKRLYQAQEEANRQAMRNEHANKRFYQARVEANRQAMQRQAILQDKAILHAQTNQMNAVAFKLQKQEEWRRIESEGFKRDAEARAQAKKARVKLEDDWETQKALCRRCAHSNPCPFSYAQKCGPDYQFTCA